VWCTPVDCPPFSVSRPGEVSALWTSPLAVTGTETWFHHPLNRKVVYTEGMQYVAEKGGAYWLIDEIALIQPLGSISGWRARKRLLGMRV